MRIDHLALRVRDLLAAALFYAGTLGLEEVGRSHHADGRLRSVWLRAGDTILMLEEALAGVGAESGSGALVALRVDDLAAWEQRLAAGSVAIDARSARSLYFRDPDGHRVAVTLGAQPD